MKHVEQRDDTPRRPPTQKSLPCREYWNGILFCCETHRVEASHANGPFRNSQSRNAMSNTAPPTIKTIHSSGVIGRFTYQQHTPGLATSRAITSYSGPAAVERVRIHAWLHCTIFSNPLNQALQVRGRGVCVAQQINSSDLSGVVRLFLLVFLVLSTVALTLCIWA